MKNNQNDHSSAPVYSNFCPILMVDRRIIMYFCALKVQKYKAKNKSIWPLKPPDEQ